MIQMASCSYDVHMQEIIGALMVGCSIVMLHPQGHMDLGYLLEVLREKQVSYMQSVPAYLTDVINFLLQQNHPKINSLRIIDVGGTRFVSELIDNTF